MNDQPTNQQLLDALESARQSSDYPSDILAYRIHVGRVQVLAGLRNLRTTWFDSDELKLRRDIDEYLAAGKVTP